MNNGVISQFVSDNNTGRNNPVNIINELNKPK